MGERIIIESVKDALAVASTIVESAEKEVAWLLQPALLVFCFQFGITNKSKMLIEKGGHVRGITRVSGTYFDPVRKLLDNGEEVRHIDQYGERSCLSETKKKVSVR